MFARIPVTRASRVAIEAGTGMHGSDTPTPGDAERAQLTEQDALRCVPGLRAVLLRMTRNRDTAADLAQEVILNVIVAIRAGRLRDPAALPAYVHRAARNAVYMLARKQQPEPFEELPDREALWEARARTPLEQCEDDEIRRLARSVLEELPTPRDREIVRGFYVNGSSKAVLMELFGLDKDQFDRVISRARMRMRELLAAKMNETSSQAGGTVPRHISSEQGRGGSST